MENAVEQYEGAGMRTANLKEWIGRTDNEAIPPRVKVRVFGRSGGRCTKCERSIGGSVRPAYDHIIPLIAGGGNRESNLQLLCVSPCHAEKTRADVADKAVVARKRQKHLGIRKPSRFPGSRDSGFKKRMDGTVVRR